MQIQQHLIRPGVCVHFTLQTDHIEVCRKGGISVLVCYLCVTSTLQNKR